MSGRIIAIAIILLSLITGGSIYYLQVFYYYKNIPSKGLGDVMLLPKDAITPQPIAVRDFQAIDAESSPIRYRACFTAQNDQASYVAQYKTSPKAEPLNAPFWFSCFDAEAIGEAIKTGEAMVFVSYENEPYGFDRVVAILPDGRGFAWNQINECGVERYESKSFNPKCPQPN